MNKKQAALRWLADQYWVESFFHIQIFPESVHLLGFVTHDLVTAFTKLGAKFEWDNERKWLNAIFHVDVYGNPDELLKINLTLSIR